MLGGEGQSQAIADAAAALARLPDGFAPKSFSKGLRASRRWQVPGPARKRSVVSRISPAWRCRNYSKAGREAPVSRRRSLMR